MTPSRLTALLLVSGILGVLDAIVLLAVDVGLNTGTVFFALVGLPLAAWGLWRWKNGHTPLPWPPAVKRLLTWGLSAFALSIVAGSLLLMAAARDRSDQPVDCLVILGAGLSGDRPTAALVDRLERAAAWLTANPGIPVVVSGGKGPGETRAEAEAMREFLVAKGIAPGRILREDRSVSTWENLRFTKALLAPRFGARPRVLVATSDFHLFRALFLAGRAGLAATGLPCPTPWYQYPNCLARECLAVLKSWILDT